MAAPRKRPDAADETSHGTFARHSGRGRGDLFELEERERIIKLFLKVEVFFSSVNYSFTI